MDDIKREILSDAIRLNIETERELIKAHRMIRVLSGCVIILSVMLIVASVR